MAGPSKRLVTAAIDFGTTYTSWAFSFKHSFEKDPAKIETKQWPGGGTISLKGPTVVLIHPDGKTLHSFGYDAEDKYAELSASGDHEAWYFFQRFKMSLFTDKGLARDLMLADACGKNLAALMVFGLSIRFMKDDLIKTSQTRVAGLKDADINWVLTVPAIWTDAARQFMREAAEWAGISHDSLIIALEPECASVLCCHVPMVLGSAGDSVKAFAAGSKYMIVDAGGGTVDITVHEVTESGQLRELCKASGGAWGGTRVDAAFVAFLAELFGQSVIDKLPKEEMEDYIDLLRDFEMKKRTVRSDTCQQVTIKLPSSIRKIYKKEHDRAVADAVSSSTFPDLSIQGDKLRMKSKMLRDFFNESVAGTITAVSTLLKEPEAAGVTTLVLVGGLSESSIYRDAVKQGFAQMTVVVPQDASLAVLKGAVIYGHDPLTVCERVVRYTYGFETTHTFCEKCSHSVGRRKIDENGDMRCYDIFSVYAKMGSRVKVGREGNTLSSYPITDDQDRITKEIYASSTENPQLITETGCLKLGYFTININNKGRNQKFLSSMTFGGTEIQVSVKEVSTGTVTKATVNFLG